MTLRVSIEQAAANALAGWLGQKLLDVVVEPRWADPDKRKPEKSITVVTAGERHDVQINLRQLSKTNSGPDNVTAVWQIKACSQPFQLDVWAESDVERDDIKARLDDYLNAGESALTGAYDPDPVGDGLLLLLADGWSDTTADFIFDGPNDEDTPDSGGRAVYRSTYRCEAHFMLTVSSTTARQKLIQFKQALSETDTYPDPDTIGIT